MTTTLQLIEAAVREINNGDEDSFGTLIVQHAEDRWLQYAPGAINAAYPFSDAPERRLVALPFDEMIEWTPKNFLTIELNRPPEELAAWIDGYFKEVLGCDPGHQLRWGREQ